MLVSEEHKHIYPNLFVCSSKKFGSLKKMSYTKDTENLRQLVNPITVKLDDNTLGIAPHPQFIIAEGRKFYIKMPLDSTEVKEDSINAKLCKMNHCKSTGFLVALKPIPTHSELAAYQCDSCKLFYIMGVKSK